MSDDLSVNIIEELIVLGQEDAELEVTISNPEISVDITENEVSIAPIEETILYLVEGVPGVQGQQGVPGPAGGQVSVTAGEDITTYQVVALVSGIAYKADPTNINHAYTTVGLAASTAASGNPVNIATSGPLTGGSFTPGVNYFAGLSGNLSTTAIAPGAVWAKKIAVSEDNSTDIIVQDTEVYVL